MRFQRRAPSVSFVSVDWDARRAADLRKAVVDLHLLRVERYPGRSRLQHQQGGEILIPEAVPDQRLDLLSREVMPALGSSATNIHARPLTTRAIVESWNGALA